MSAVLDDLRASEELATATVSGVSLEQGNWHPASGWSIWQILDHLARVNSHYGTALAEALSRSASWHPGRTETIRPGFLNARFVRSLEPPVRTRLKSPAKGLPGSTGPVKEALERFLGSHQLLREIAKSGATVDLNRIRFRNPFLSVLRFTVGGALLIVNAHDRRHLWQIAQVKSAPGYPAT